jgi:AraC-like DNA-binding protein
MPYVARIPGPPLDAYIDDLYYLDSPPPAPRLKVFPMPSLHLMINLGSGFEVSVAGKADRVDLAESWCTGMWDTCHVVRYPAGDVRLYGVHFKPGGAAPFLRLSLSDLRNQIAPLDALWGRRAREIRERLQAASSIPAGLSLLEELMLERLCETSDKLSLVQHAISQIVRHQGSLSIRALSKHFGVSHNHLGVQFNHLVGVTPKELARLYRFAHVLGSIELTRPVDWTRLAHQAGFYDQSHFNKEFAAFTGLNPTEYLRERVRLRIERPEYQQQPGNMPLPD